MRLIDNFVMGCKRAYAIGSTQIRKHAPEIEFGIGAVFVVVGAFKLYSAGKESGEAGRKDVLEKQIEEIDKGFTPKSLKEKAKRKATFEYVRSEAVCVLPGALATTGGLLIMKHGFDRLSLAKRALEGALAASVAATNKIAQTLEEQVGTVNAEAAITGSERETIELQTLQPDGEMKTEIKDRLIFNVDDIFDLPGEAFIYSNETCSGFFQDNDDYFNSLLTDILAEGRRQLNNTHGYVFSETLVRLFGVEPKALHHTCGSVMPDPKHPRPGDENRKGIFEFDTRKIYIEYPDKSRTNGWLVIPKNDGSIIDIYDKYSLQRLLVKERLNRK